MKVQRVKLRFSILAVYISLCVILTIPLLAQETDEPLIYVTDIEWSPEGNLLAVAWGSGPDEICNTGPYIISLLNGDLTLNKRLNEHGCSITGIDFNEDGSQLISVDHAGWMRLWDVEMGTVIHTIIDNTSWKKVAWSSGNKYDALMDDNSIIVGYTFSEETLAGYVREGHPPGEPPTGYLTDASWSPDGRYIVICDTDSTVKIWDITANNNIVYTFEGHDTPVHSVAWSPTGDAIASGDANGTIHVWEPFTGEIIATLTGHTSTIEALDWNPTGRMLVSGSDDGTLRVWDVEEGSEIASVLLSGAVMAADWSPDGQKIAYGGIDEAKQDGAYDVIQAPVLVGLRAHAGADQTIETSDGKPVIVTLDGSWSQSTVGDIGSYAWRQNGDVIATGINPEVTLDPGIHVITLTIFNDYIRSDSDEVVIQVLESEAIGTAEPQ